MAVLPQRWAPPNCASSRADRRPIRNPAAGLGCQSKTLPLEAADIVAESGGLPFALAIIGAMAAVGQSWNEILTLLRERDLDLREAEVSRLRASAPAHARSMPGVEALRQAEPLAADLYLDLAVFRAGIVVPEAAVLRFWRRRSGR